MYAGNFDTVFNDYLQSRKLDNNYLDRTEESKIKVAIRKFFACGF